MRNSGSKLHNQIVKELVEMVQYDFQVREELLKEGKLSPGYNPDMEHSIFS